MTIQCIPPLSVWHLDLLVLRRNLRLKLLHACDLGLLVASYDLLLCFLHPLSLLILLVSVNFTFSYLHFLEELIIELCLIDSIDEAVVDWAFKVSTNLFLLLDALLTSIVLTRQHVGK